MRQIVLSGINLFSGGTLTIYREMIKSLIEAGINNKYQVVCFVHKISLFTEYENDVKLIEISDSRNSYKRRLYYEYKYFNKYSNEHDVYIWISVQDITPTVKAEKLFTYCHNPMMFYKLDWKEIKYAKRLAIFSLLYKYVYKRNIENNTYVVVQQDWIRREFKKAFGISNILVARPVVENMKIANICVNDGIKRFIFASQATFFKNFEVICQAAKILEDQSITNFECILTIDGSESKYSHAIREKYDGVKNIKWVGFQPQGDLLKLYGTADYMIFPSKLETWGLPISEFKQTGKPIILADLPYAHETIGNYDSAIFFDPDNSVELAEIMRNCINGTCQFKKIKDASIEAPHVDSWSEFWKFIMGV